MGSSDLGLFIGLAVIAFIWLLPLLTIISSSKTTGKEKIAWVFAVLFISWFAWIFYMLLAPINSKNKFHAMDHYQFAVNDNEKSTTINTTRQATIDTPRQGKAVSSKPTLKDWTNENPGKSINDYYSKFGR